LIIDRVRNNGNSYKYKQRNDNFSSAKQSGTYSNQANKKGQFNYQKQPRSRSVWGGKRTKVCVKLLNNHACCIIG